VQYQNITTNVQNICLSLAKMWKTVMKVFFIFNILFFNISYFIFYF